MNNGPIALTHRDLVECAPSERVALVEAYALNLLTASSAPGSKPLEVTTRLAEAGMDSLQVVELKFSLDELIGRESSVEMYISNPTISELARAIVAAAAL